MLIARPPAPALRPFVAIVWASDDPPAARDERPRLEHLLPTGTTHLALRMTELPLRIRETPADAGVLLGGAVVGGPRPHYVIREATTAASSVGAVLRPGAARWLLGAGADELAGRHTPLGDLWGAAAATLRERLLGAAGAEDRLVLLEAELEARLPRVRALHPALAAMLAQADPSFRIAAAVARSGISHRAFIAQFRQAVGLAPKAYQRILRFQQALRDLRRGESLAAVASGAGYSDQAHFGRDFLEFSGTTPAAYRARMPAHANHLPVTATGIAAGQLRSRPRRAGCATIDRPEAQRSSR